MIDLYASIILFAHTDNKARICVSFLLPLINPHDMLQNWIIKKENWTTRAKMRPKGKKKKKKGKESDPAEREIQIECRFTQK